MPLHRFLLIPAQIGEGKPQKIYFPPGVSGEGIPRLFGSCRDLCNTFLNNLGGHRDYITLFMRLFWRIRPPYSRRPFLIRNKRN